jgi:RND superfamily putative drug exporter
VHRYAGPSTGTSHQVAVRAPADRQSAVTAALADLVRRTKSDGLFAQGGLEQPRVSKDGTVTVLEVATPYEAAASGRAIR